MVLVRFKCLTVHPCCSGQDGVENDGGMNCESCELDPENPFHESHITQLISALIQELEVKAASMANEDPYLIRVKLINAAQNFRVTTD